MPVDEFTPNLAIETVNVAGIVWVNTHRASRVATRVPSDVASARRASVSETVCSYAVWNAPTATRRAFVAAPRGGALGVADPEEGAEWGADTAVRDGAV